jgi:hypothetical protein
MYISLFALAFDPREWSAPFNLSSGLIGSSISEILYFLRPPYKLRDGVQNSQSRSMTNGKNEQPKSCEENSYLKPEWRREALVEKCATESKL